MTDILKFETLQILTGYNINTHTLSDTVAIYQHHQYEFEEENFKKNIVALKDIRKVISAYSEIATVTEGHILEKFTWYTN